MADLHPNEALLFASRFGDVAVVDDEGTIDVDGLFESRSGGDDGDVARWWRREAVAMASGDDGDRKGG